MIKGKTSPPVISPQGKTLNKETELRNLSPSAARLCFDLLSTRCFLHPSLKGLSFIGSAYIYFVTKIYNANISTVKKNNIYNFFEFALFFTKLIKEGLRWKEGTQAYNLKNLEPKSVEKLFDYIFFDP